jgi:hypothetical protein
MNVETFYSKAPCLEDYWRGIILFGRNVATYKFALAKSLLDINPQSGQLVKLSDLAPYFAGHIAEHLKLADKQATSASSKFLDACRKLNQGEIEKAALVDETVRLGFNNVIDAFHVIGQGDIPKRFFIDERGQNNGIRITDEFSRLATGTQLASLKQEVESRWRLVETAWELGVSRGLMSIDFDPQTESLFSIDRALRRKPVTSSRGALNGYQKGKCFYCFCDISVDEANPTTDVDHFFPHTLKQSGFGSAIDGVWNLVLACRDCNRGANGKFARVPTINLLERLSRRNEYLIGSHHPLRETLIQQTGATISARTAYLNDVHQRAWVALIHLWEPEAKGPSLF